jgi:hypothetical protein
MRTSIRSLITAAFLLLIAASAAAAHARPDRLPLGRPGLPEHRTVGRLAPGLTETTIVRGLRTRRDVFTVEAAFAGSRAQAADAARRLRLAGFAPQIVRIDDRAPDDHARGPLGFSVRTGSFATQPEADALKLGVAAAGFPSARTLFTGEDGGRTSGPWVVQVLSIDPRAFDGRVVNALGTDVIPGREALTSLADRTSALAAVNGGYFVIGAANGTDGDLAGISVLDGRLVSEAVEGRTSLVLPAPSGAGAFLDALSTRDSVRAADGARRELDGLNRTPGLIRACGGVGDDLPTERPLHDVTCTDPSELIRFDPVFGEHTEPGAGSEAVLSADGIVTALRDARGGPIPADGSVLSGTGEAAEWLSAHARPGTELRATLAVAGERGPLALRPGLGVINGGPRLLRDGAQDIDALAEGFVHPDDPSFYYSFAVRRNPRTMAGVDRRGRLLLVTVDGRAPGHSVGASFREEAAIMRALGAHDALNLDGGGSTTMVAGGRLLTRPSDATGERPIGDAILVER